jgi:predicted transport protein
LIRYSRFDQDLLLFELVNAVEATEIRIDNTQLEKTKGKYKDKSVSEQLSQASQKLRDVYEALKAMLVGFGDDVQVKMLKLYVAFKRIKNFASVEVHAGQDRLIVYVKVDPDTVQLEEGFTRDVREIGHWGTGSLEIILRTIDDLEKAKTLLEKSYEAT